MCPPKGIRCPPSHKSICSCYCIFKVDSGLSWLALSLSQVPFVCFYIGGYLSGFAEYRDPSLKTYGKAINNDKKPLFMNPDPKENVF